MLEEWEERAGVQAEIRIARELGKPVRYLAADDACDCPMVARVPSSGRR
jgi:hypothetical protein